MSEKNEKTGLQNKKLTKAEKKQIQAEELERSLKALKSIADETQSSKAKHDKDFEYLNKTKTRKERREEKKKNKEDMRQPLSLVGKIILCLLGAAVAFFAIYLAYYFIHYVGYKGYKQYLTTETYEEGTAYSPMSGSNVKGFDLVAKSEYLELYTDTKSCNVAVYDTRTGETYYTNPVNADQDTIANGANVNMLKSQFILSYYNDDVATGSWNSYKDCVAGGAYTYESIENGIRYIYTIGDSTAQFIVPLEYRLYDDYMEVTIPSDHIQELGGGYVYRIQLLRYMAATSYDDEGCIVVPNGTGSIINYNNGKTSAASYSQYIYDIDPLAATYTNVEPLETARLPLYGMCSDDHGMLVTIEEASTNCVISAGISGVYNDYNYAYPTFVLRTVDDLKNFGDSTTSVQVMEKDFYTTPICVRYTPLTSDYAGYSGLANYYRERLINEGVLTANENADDIPFYYDVIGGVKETGHFLGVQYLHSFSMTTFDQAEEMSDQLTSLGVSNQVMNFQGWFNGGYYHNAVDSVNIMSKLGGKSGLEDLNAALEAKGGTLYADVALQKVTAADKMFPYSQVASRYYGSGYTARFGLVNPTTYRNTSSLGYTENIYAALSPKFLPRYVKSFVNKTDNLDISGYSLRDLGNYLVSDKKRTCPIERDEALEIVEGQFDLLESTGKSLMTSEANEYAFAYSTDIINVPLYDTEYEIVDDQIPLYEMIIHGYINYGSELLNYENSDDMDNVELQLIESGAAPHYVFTWDDASDMKLTALNSYYNSTFANWAEEAAETYAVVNEALKDVQNAAIIKHEIIDENVRKVTYDNGISILVNYGSTDETVDGITVPANGYATEGR